MLLSDDQLKPNRLLHSIIEADKKNFTYIILGRSGPTGKTWLSRELKTFGFNAIEISEDIYGIVEYTDYKNHVIINEADNLMIIILNESIR